MKSAAEPHAEIPDKIFFRIGEVARYTALKPYVLRYWETEFPILRPKKSRSGQRLYRRSDIDTVLEIKTLLRERRFTIRGARAELLRLRRARSQEDGEDETVRFDAGMDGEPPATADAGPPADAGAPVDGSSGADLAPSEPDGELGERALRQQEALRSVGDALIDIRAEVQAFREQS